MSVNLLKDEKKEELLDYCYQRYELDQCCWANKSLIKTKDALWLINEDMLSFLKEQDHQIEFESLGIRCFSGRQFPYKITDGFFKVFGAQIKRRCLMLDAQDTYKMLKGESINLATEKCPYDGYILLFHENTYFGIGLKKGDLLISQIPKSMRSQLGKELEIRDK